jgi:DNA-directed RNA polymerase subunit RPC12/RpoP
MTKYAYCTVCKKEVENPSRKPITTFHKVLWVLLSIATVGIGAIIYLIILANKPKIYCPTCFTKLKFSKESYDTEKEEEPKTPKEKILKKAGKREDIAKKKPKSVTKEGEEGKIEKIEDTFCPFCGEDISSSEKRCPYCGSKL